MAARTGSGGIAIQIDSAEWYRLSKQLRAYDPKLLTALRKRLRNAGQFAVNKIRANLAMPSPDGGPDTGKSRDILARATKVTISFSQKQAGAKVTTSGRNLPPENRAVLKVYNKHQFRHPVFGDKQTWVTQRGRPYFAEAFESELLRVARQEIEDALDEAVSYLKRGI